MGNLSDGLSATLAGSLCAATFLGLALLASPAYAVDSDVQKAYDEHVKANMPGFSIDDVQAAKKAGTVTYYFPNSNSNAAAVKLFEKNFPFVSIKPIQMAGGAVTERFLAEQRNGQHIADVMNTSDEVALLDAAKEGLCTKYVPSSDSVYLDTAKQAGAGLVYRYGGTTLGMVYVPSKLTKEQIDSMSEWSTLGNPAWKGKVFGWVNAAAGGSLLFSDIYLYQKYGDKIFKDNRALASKISIYDGTNAVTQAVVQGEVDITGPTGISGPQGLWEKGADIAWTVPSPTLSAPLVGCIAKNAPHLAAAKLFWDWLLSSEAQTVMGELGSFSYRQGFVPKDPEKLTKQAWYRPLDTKNVVEISNDTIAKLKQPVLDAWNAVYGNK